MSGAATPGQDPSMEDILASIRKILNEEEVEPAAGKPQAQQPARLPEPEPLELTEAMLVAPPEPRAPTPPVPRVDAMAEIPAAARTPAAPARVEPAPAPVAPPPVAPAPVALAPEPPPRAAEAPAPEDGPEDGPAAAPVAAPAAPRANEGLVAPATAAAAAALLGQLARTVAAERTAPVHRSGPSIEDVVREELRPLLKEWLDTHLPPLMERLVRAEIERVVSRSLG